METPFTLLDEERPVTVPATIDRDRVRLAPAALRMATGWELKPDGLCRAERCIPVRQRAALVHDAGIDLAACADVLGRPHRLSAHRGRKVLLVAYASW